MANKIVISLMDMDSDKSKKDALQSVTRIDAAGIDSLSVNLKERTLTVIGSADPVDMVNLLRKKFRRVELVHFGAVPPTSKPKEEKSEKKPKEEQKEEKGKEEKKEKKSEEKGKEEKKVKKSDEKKEEKAQKKAQEEKKEEKDKKSEEKAKQKQKEERAEKPKEARKERRVHFS